jgi:transcriptional regulator with XRE-family HTH domain
VGKGGAPSGEFGHYVVAAIEAAGYRSPTAFARAAGMQPSVVLRWISGTTEPTAPLLLRAAPHLRVEEADLFAAAFGTEDRPPPKPLPAAFDNLADEYDLADERAKELILEQVRRISEWARWRRERD